MRIESGVTSLVEYAAGSTTGACRAVDEDALGVFPQGHVFVVVDGCGYSDETLGEFVVPHFADAADADPGRSRAASTLASRADQAAEASLGDDHPLARAVIEANAALYRQGRASAERRGLGATLCALSVSDRAISIVHVGDCRVGRRSGGRFAWLTRDHSLVEDLRRRGASAEEIARAAELHANVVTRAVGMEHVEVDLSHQPAVGGDIYLLCSDGLTRQVDDDRIAELLGDETRSLADRCAALLDASEAAGGHDNATVVLLRLLDAA